MRWSAVVETESRGYTESHNCCLSLHCPEAACILVHDRPTANNVRLHRVQAFCQKQIKPEILLAKSPIRLLNSASDLMLGRQYGVRPAFCPGHEAFFPLCSGLSNCSVFVQT